MTPLGIALGYIARGWSPVPIPHREKAPKVKAWQTLRITEHTADQYFNGAAGNVGVLLGEASGGLVDVDLDHPAAVRHAATFLPATGSIFGRTTNRSSHRLYVCADARATRQWKLPTGETLIEVRGGGGQTVFPGSTQPSGEPVRWEIDDGPAEVAANDLHHAAGLLAAAVMIGLAWPAEGARDEAAMAVTGALARAGWRGSDIEAFVEAVIDVAGDPERAMRLSKVRRTRERVDAGEPATGLPKLRELLGEAVASRFSEWLGLRDAKRAAAINPARPDWYQQTQTGARGNVLGNLANVLIALRSDPEFDDAFAYDEMARSALFRGQAIADDHVNRVHEWLELQGLQTVAAATVHQAVDMVCREYAFHPVRQYLGELTWDGVPRVETWLPRYMGATGTDYTRAVGRMFLVAMVARVLRPGCKADHMIVFEGKQGTRKSTACRILGGDWFSDNLPSDVSNRDAAQHLRGRWLVEVAELNAMSKTEVAAFKAFVTRDVDKYRPPYGRHEVNDPRQCVFAGTTNDKTYLRDPTGARRYWPVECGTIDTDLLARDRDQLFAEAVALYNHGLRWWPDQAFESAHIAPEQDARREEDPWEDATRRFLVGKAAVTVGEVARDAIQIDLDKTRPQDALRIRNILQLLGWKPSKRTMHARPWVPVVGAGDR